MSEKDKNVLSSVIKGFEALNGNEAAQQRALGFCEGVAAAASIVKENVKK